MTIPVKHAGSFSYLVVLLAIFFAVVQKLDTFLSWSEADSYDLLMLTKIQ
jgi:hypothetical protein